MIYEVLTNGRTYLCDKQTAMKLLDIDPAAFSRAKRKNAGARAIKFKRGWVSTLEMLDVTNLDYEACYERFEHEQNERLSELAKQRAADGTLALLKKGTEQ